MKTEAEKKTNKITKSIMKQLKAKRKRRRDWQCIHGEFHTMSRSGMSLIEDSDFSRLYYERDGHRIYCADVLNFIEVGADSVDLVVTSPPYNLGIEYGSHYDQVPYGEYLRFTKRWLQICERMMKPNGRICVNIPVDTTRGGERPIYAHFVHLAESLGFVYHSSAVWINGKNNCNSTAWGSWLSASAPQMVSKFEMVVVMHLGDWRRAEKRETGIDRRDFMNWTKGVWNFPSERSIRNLHPAPFPVELPKRCIQLFSFVGDVVLDPFCGSGTTLIAAHRNQRIGIGVDVDPEYCGIASRRLRDETRIQEFDFA